MADRNSMIIGNFRVSTLRQRDLISEIAALGTTGTGVRAAFALHVGGLAHVDDPDVIRAYGAGDYVYADGMAVVLAGLLTNGRWVERSATTDIGIPILKAVAQRLGRAPRIALIGGEPGLAAAAGSSIEQEVESRIVVTRSGFADDWSSTIRDLEEAEPDVTLVGLGSPREMLWVAEHRELLPSSLYVTCGGWFNFLAGRERRAPRLLQRLGLEWVFRVIQNPRSKALRYVTGVWHLIRTVVIGRRKRISDQ